MAVLEVVDVDVCVREAVDVGDGDAACEGDCDGVEACEGVALKPALTSMVPGIEKAEASEELNASAESTKGDWALLRGSAMLNPDAFVNAKRSPPDETSAQLFDDGR